MTLTDLPRGSDATRRWAYLRFHDGRSANFGPIAVSSNLHPYQYLVQVGMVDEHVYSAGVQHSAAINSPYSMCSTLDRHTLE